MDRAAQVIPALMLILSTHATRLCSLSEDQRGSLARDTFLFAVQQCHAGQTAELVATGQPRSVYPLSRAMCRAIWWQAAGPQSGPATGASIGVVN